MSVSEEKSWFFRKGVFPNFPFCMIPLSKLTHDKKWDRGFYFVGRWLPTDSNTETASIVPTGRFRNLFFFKAEIHLLVLFVHFCIYKSSNMIILILLSKGYGVEQNKNRWWKATTKWTQSFFSVNVWPIWEIQYPLLLLAGTFFAFMYFQNCKKKKYT